MSMQSLNAQVERARVSRVQNVLTENRSWKTSHRDLVELLDSPNPAIVERVQKTLLAMNQQAMIMESLRHDPKLEATFTQALGPLVPKILDVVRIFYPNMITHDLVDVQPMDRQNGEIFIIRPVYTTTAAGRTAGDQVFRQVTDGTYASEKTVATTTGSGAGPYTATLTPVPVRKGTLFVYDVATLVAQDDGNGNITGATVSAGSVNYATGAFTVTFTGAATGAVTVQYRYDSEQTTTSIRSLDIQMLTLPVTAEGHPLRIQWSIQAQLAAASHLDVDIPETLSNLAASFIKQERDIQVINMILSGATHDSSLDINVAPPSNYSRLAKYAEFEVKINEAENQMQADLGRGGVSWLLCGNNVSAVVRNVAGFESADVVAPIGPHVIGTLRDKTVKVVKVPTMDTNTYVVGFKGYVAGDSSLVLGEWVPLYATPVWQSPDLYSAQGLTSFYALVSNQPKYFRKGVISGYAS